MALESSSNTLCLLRKIKLHADFADFAFCHHWTKKENSLTPIEVQAKMIDKQLDFARDLVLNDI